MKADEARVLLGFLPNSHPTPSQVKEAYKRKALETHPDRFPPHEKSHAECSFKSISEAYTCLQSGNPLAHMLYDIRTTAKQRVYFGMFRLKSPLSKIKIIEANYPATQRKMFVWIKHAAELSHAMGHYYRCKTRRFRYRYILFTSCENRSSEGTRRKKISCSCRSTFPSYRFGNSCTRWIKCCQGLQKAEGGTPFLQSFSPLILNGNNLYYQLHV